MALKKGAQYFQKKGELVYATLESPSQVSGC